VRVNKELREPSANDGPAELRENAPHGRHYRRNVQRGTALRRNIGHIEFSSASVRGSSNPRGFNKMSLKQIGWTA